MTNVTSVGRLISILGQTFEAIERAERQLGIDAWRLDGVAHYTEAEVEQLREHFNQRRRGKCRRKRERV